MFRSMIMIALLLAAVPAQAQVRVTVNGQTQDVPSGMVRTVYEKNGRQTITDRPWTGAATPGAASVTTTETVEEDEYGHVISRRMETRIEPQYVAYAQPSVQVVQYAPPPPPQAPAPRLEPDLGMFEDDAPSSMPRMMRIKRDGWGGHFVAKVRINGVQIKAIIDTGATYTILTPDDARAVGADRDVFRQEAAVGIGGYTAVGVTKLRSMEIAGQQFGGMVARIGQPGISYTLIGQTEIARLGRVVIENGVMTIIPRGVQTASR